MVMIRSHGCTGRRVSRKSRPPSSGARASRLKERAALFMTALRLAHIHGAVRFFQRAAKFGMGAEQGNPGGGAGGNGLAAELEAEPVDGLFQQGRLGPGVGLAQVPQQQREFVTAK